MSQPHRNDCAFLLPALLLAGPLALGLDVVIPLRTPAKESGLRAR